MPPEQRQDPRLWGECISGALTEDELLTFLERAGFYGIECLSRTFWKEVEGYRFFSVTVRGYKFEKRKGCVFTGQWATYVGPYKGVSDEEGHFFPRGIAVEALPPAVRRPLRRHRPRRRDHRHPVLRPGRGVLLDPFTASTTGRLGERAPEARRA